MFDVLVLGGGGTRCLWQSGFLHGASKRLLSPRHIVAVSAGALSAVSYAVGNGKHVREELKRSFQSIDHNVRWGAFLNEKTIAPHLQAYRQALARAFNDSDLQKLHKGPVLSILLTRPPRLLPHKVAAILGVCAYQLDLVVRGKPHSVLAGKLGFRSAWVKANDVKTTADLCDLLIAAGCIPPIIPLQTWRQAPALDGGLMDNAPIAAWEAHRGQTNQALVLVTRRYRRLPDHRNRVYVQPSTPIPASKLDFTDPGQIEAAYELGKRDGARFWARLHDNVSPQEAAQSLNDG